MLNLLVSVVLNGPSPTRGGVWGGGGGVVMGFCLVLREKIMLEKERSLKDECYINTA